GWLLGPPAARDAALTGRRGWVPPTAASASMSAANSSASGALGTRAWPAWNPDVAVTLSPRVRGARASSPNRAGVCSGGDVFVFLPRLRVSSFYLRGLWVTVP